MKIETWTEKYRPKSMKEVIGAPEDVIRLLATPTKLPHLLLHSKQPGTGKTSIAEAIGKDLKATVLEMNASDERKIEDIREKVKRFVQTAAIGGGMKIVILDECDGMIKGSQEALRRIMEKYPARFIITANNLEKIIPALQSRCRVINLQFPKRDEILGRLAKICIGENVEIDTEALTKVIDIHYPSIRDMITTLQMLSIQNIKITEDMVKKKEEHYKIMYDMIKTKPAPEVRREWITNGYPPHDVLRAFFEFAMEDMSLISSGAIKPVIELIAEAEYRMAVTADPDITMFWLVMKLRGVMNV